MLKLVKHDNSIIYSFYCLCLLVAGTRILKRLRKRVETVKPPPLALATNPLPVLNDQIYTSPQLLITTLKRDVTLIIQEAR